VWRDDCRGYANLDGLCGGGPCVLHATPSSNSVHCVPVRGGTQEQRRSSGGGLQAECAMRRRADGMTAEEGLTSLLGAEVFAQRGARVGGVVCVGRRARALHTAGIAPPYATHAACERALRAGGWRMNRRHTAAHPPLLRSAPRVAWYCGGDRDGYVLLLGRGAVFAPSRPRHGCVALLRWGGGRRGWGVVGRQGGWERAKGRVATRAHAHFGSNADCALAASRAMPFVAGLASPPG